MYCNNVLNCIGAPPYTWLLYLLSVSFVLNHLATESLHYMTPMEAVTGSTPDIFPMAAHLIFFPCYNSILGSLSTMSLKMLHFPLIPIKNLVILLVLLRQLGMPHIQGVDRKHSEDHLPFCCLLCLEPH